MKIIIKTVKGKSINLEVEDNFNTIDLKIQGGLTRQLILDMDPGPDKVADMTIFVSTLSGKKLDIDVKKSDTIRDVKAKCEEMDGTPVDQQRIIFAGKQLEDNRTIAYYRITHESTLIMMARLCGC